MSEWTTAQLKELIGTEIVAERRHRDALRVEDGKALELIAEQTKSALESYPTLRDFNDLKNRVDIIVTLFQVLTALAAIVGLFTAFYTRGAQ